MSRNRINPATRQAQTGLTLVEVLIAVTLLSVLLVPAIQALHTGFAGADVHAEYSTNHYRLVSRLETMLAESYGNLEAAMAGSTVPSSYSDPGGTPARVLVFVAAYDVDNADADNDPFTGTDDDVLWLRVTVEGSAQGLSSLTTRW